MKWEETIGGQPVPIKYRPGQRVRNKSTGRTGTVQPGSSFDVSVESTIDGKTIVRWDYGGEKADTFGGGQWVPNSSFELRMNIYVASSWRNPLQPAIVHALRRCGHEVYDFRHPAPGNDGFAWSSIDPQWEDWTPEEYRKALQHPIAKQGYEFDKSALDRCDSIVLVLPSGRSASWEFGYAMGQGKPGYVIMFDKFEPELMYREATIIATMNELFDAFGEPVEHASTP